MSRVGDRGGARQVNLDYLHSNVKTVYVQMHIVHYANPVLAGLRADKIIAMIS